MLGRESLPVVYNGRAGAAGDNRMNLNLKKSSVGTSLVLAAFALGGYACTRAVAPPNYHFANGLELTPIDAQSDDVERALDIKTWKFNIRMPVGGQRYWYLINLHQNGKVIRSLGGGGDVPSNQRENYASRNRRSVSYRQQFYPGR